MIILVNLFMKLPEGLLCMGEIFYFINKGRICNDSTSKHNGSYHRKCLMELFIILFCKNVAIVTDWMFANRNCFSKHSPVRCIFIKVSLSSGMNNKFF